MAWQQSVSLTCFIVMYQSGYILCSRPPGSPKDLNKNAWGTIPEPLWSQSQEQSASGNGGLHLSGDLKKRKRKKKKKPEDIIIFTFT